MSRALERVRQLSVELEGVGDARAAAQVATKALLELLAADRAVIAFARTDERAIHSLELALVGGRPRTERAPSADHVAVLPLFARGRVVGGVQLERFDPCAGGFDRLDFVVGQLVADLLGAAVGSARACAVP